MIVIELRHLSPAELSIYAVELEKIAIQLTIEEGMAILFIFFSAFCFYICNVSLVHNIEQSLKCRFPLGRRCYSQHSLGAVSIFCYKYYACVV